jgi:Asp/Glu/hydantoin racemase
MTTRPENPLIALVSAVPAAIPPTEGALAESFPDARVWNILDDRLLQDAGDAGGVTPELAERMKRLIRHAVTEGADGVLLTCSMYGRVAHQIAAELRIPVFAPDDAAFAATVHGGYRTVLLISSAAGPLADSEKRLAAAAAEAGASLSIVGAVADGASRATSAGDLEALAAALYSAVQSSSAEPDAILLGQYSISPAADRLAELTGLPVLAGPQRAAVALRSALERRVQEGDAP